MSLAETLFLFIGMRCRACITVATTGVKTPKTRAAIVPQQIRRGKADDIGRNRYHSERTSDNYKSFTSSQRVGSSTGVSCGNVGFSS